MDIQISKNCISTYPCRHLVTINSSNGSNTSNKLLMTGKEIVTLFKNNKLDIPDHFKIYDIESKLKHYRRLPNSLSISNVC